MFRPNKITRLREWIARFRTPPQHYPIDLSLLDTSVLSELDIDTHITNPFVKEVFRGAPDSFMRDICVEMEDYPENDYSLWDSAVTRIPRSLSPMYLMRTQWVLWYDNGKVEVVELPRTGEWLEDGNYRSVPTYVTIPMPKGIVKAAKVGRGEFNDPGGVLGLRWVLYTT